MGYYKQVWVATPTREHCPACGRISSYWRDTGKSYYCNKCKAVHNKQGKLIGYGARITLNEDGTLYRTWPDCTIVGDSIINA